MENTAKKHISASLVWSLELGGKLRELRRRAGLTQPELTHVAGRKPGAQSLFSRLEQGRVRYPSLALIADYLRACRASFADILPLLDRYTNQPAVRESRARETALSGLAEDRSREAVRLDVYDRKTETARKRAGQKPVAPDKRAAALARQLAARKLYQALDRAVLAEVDRLGIRPSFLARQAALDYGRMVWRALELTDPGSFQNADRRVQSAKLRKKAEAENRRFFGGPQNDRNKGTAVRPGSALTTHHSSVRRRPGRPRKTRAERLRDAEARIRAQAGSTLPNKALRQIAARVIREHLARTGG